MSQGPKKTPVVRLGEDAPHYRVTKKSYIGGLMCGPDTENPTVRYAGIPGAHLEPLNDAAKKAKAAVKGHKGTLPKHLAAVSGLVDEATATKPLAS